MTDESTQLKKNSKIVCREFCQSFLINQMKKQNLLNIKPEIKSPYIYLKTKHLQQQQKHLLEGQSPSVLPIRSTSSCASKSGRAIGQPSHVHPTNHNRHKRLLVMKNDNQLANTVNVVQQETGKSHFGTINCKNNAGNSASSNLQTSKIIQQEIQRNIDQLNNTTICWENFTNLNLKSTFYETMQEYQRTFSHNNNPRCKSSQFQENKLQQMGDTNSHNYSSSSNSRHDQLNQGCNSNCSNKSNSYNKQIVKQVQIENFSFDQIPHPSQLSNNSQANCCNNNRLKALLQLQNTEMEIDSNINNSNCENTNHKVNVDAKIQSQHNEMVNEFMHLNQNYKQFYNNVRKIVPNLQNYNRSCQNSSSSPSRRRGSQPLSNHQIIQNKQKCQSTKQSPRQGNFLIKEYQEKPDNLANKQPFNAGSGCIISSGICQDIGSCNGNNNGNSPLQTQYKLYQYYLEQKLQASQQSSVEENDKTKNAQISTVSSTNKPCHLFQSKVNPDLYKTTVLPHERINKMYSTPQKQAQENNKVNCKQQLYPYNHISLLRYQKQLQQNLNSVINSDNQQDEGKGDKYFELLHNTTAGQQKGHEPGEQYQNQIINTNIIQNLIQKKLRIRQMMNKQQQQQRQQEQLSLAQQNQNKLGQQAWQIHNRDIYYQQKCLQKNSLIEDEQTQLNLILLKEGSSNQSTRKNSCQLQLKRAGSNNCSNINNQARQIILLNKSNISRTPERSPRERDDFAINQKRSASFIQVVFNDQKCNNLIIAGGGFSQGNKKGLNKSELLDQKQAQIFQAGQVGDSNNSSQSTNLLNQTTSALTSQNNISRTLDNSNNREQQLQPGSSCCSNNIDIYQKFSTLNKYYEEKYAQHLKQGNKSQNCKFYPRMVQENYFQSNIHQAQKNEDPSLTDDIKPWAIPLPSEENNNFF